jgi:hypothetical protein
MLRNLIYLVGALLASPVCEAAVIYTYTLELSFPIAGDHTISWTSLISCCPLSDDVMTSEGRPTGTLRISQLPSELRILFSLLTPLNHRIEAAGTSFITPGFIFPVPPEVTGTFSPIQQGGGVGFHCGPPDPFGHVCGDPYPVELSTSARLSIEAVPEPSSGLITFLGLTAVGMRVRRLRYGQRQKVGGHLGST